MRIEYGREGKGRVTGAWKRVEFEEGRGV